MAPPGRTPTSKIAQMKAAASRARTSKADIARDLDIARGRKEFFSNRPDVSDDRALRRMTQADELQRFKNLYTKPVVGSSNLLQMKQGAPRSLAEEEMRLARQYGPTFREIGSDISYGLGSIGSALGQKVMAGEFGLLGIAKGLYEQFTNKAAQAKDALVKGVNKLSDIDIEILKNKDTGKYKFTSKKPEIQEVETLQNTQMTELDKANIVRQGIEQLETTPVTGTTTLPQQPPGFKVMPTGAPSVSYFPGRYGATPVPNNIQQAQNPDELRRALMENTRPMPNNFPQEKPYLMQQDDYYYQDKERFSPQGDQYLYASENNMNNLTESGQMIYDRMKNLNMSPERINERMQEINESNLSRGTLGPLFAAEGGSVDSKLNDLQKKTNNIYGTGILSVR